MTVINEGLQDKREIIIAAGRELFLEKGYHQTRVEDIAARAGVAKGTIYLYFPSKSDLFTEIIQRAISTYKTAIHEAAESANTAREKLEAVTRETLRISSTHRSLAKVFIEAPGGMLPELKHHIASTRQECIQTFRRIIDLGIAEGTFRQVDPTLAALAVYGFINSVFHERLFDRCCTAFDTGNPSAAPAKDDLLRKDQSVEERLIKEILYIILEGLHLKP